MQNCKKNSKIVLWRFFPDKFCMHANNMRQMRASGLPIQNVPFFDRSHSNISLELLASARIFQSSSLDTYIFLLFCSILLVVKYNSRVSFRLKCFEVRIRIRIVYLHFFHEHVHLWQSTSLTSSVNATYIFAGEKVKTLKIAIYLKYISG